MCLVYQSKVTQCILRIMILIIILIIILISSLSQEQCKVYFSRFLFSVCIFNLSVCFNTNLEAPYCCFRSKMQNLLSVVAMKRLNLSGKSKPVSCTADK